MHLNATPPEPCIRDLHELLRDHLPQQLVMLTSLQKFEQRCYEIVGQHLRFHQEASLVLTGEARWRQRCSSQFLGAGSRAEEA